MSRSSGGDGVGYFVTPRSQVRALPVPWMPIVTVLGVALGMLIRGPHWVLLSAAGLEIGTTRARSIPRAHA